MAEITYKSLFESLRKNEDGLSLLFLRSADIRTHQRVANIVRLEIGIINRATNRLQLHPKRQAKLAPKEAKPNPDKLCPVCKGAKTLSLHDVPNINATEQTCDNCNGTGEAKEGQIPYKKPCPHCLEGIILDTSDGISTRIRTCSECHGSGDLFTEAEKALQAQINAAYEAMEAETIAETEPAIPVSNAVVVVNAQSKALPKKPKRFVQVNWTGRGFSSGKFELVEEKEMYGKCWYRIKVETDVVRHQWLLPEKCKEVVR